MNVIKMENWLPLFLQKHLERDRFLSHLFPLNVCIMNLSYSFISSRRTTKEWQLGCKDGSGGLWLVFAWFCKNAVEHGGSFSTKETARQNLCLSPMFMLPQRVPFLWYIYIYIYFKTNKPLGHQNWCLPWIFGGGQDDVNFFAYCWPQFPTISTAYSRDLDRILRWNLLVRQKKLTSTWAGTR